MNENFGIMDQAYFTSKSEILQWINSLLQVSVTKIESLGSGGVYCQILDSMDTQNRIPMHKVKFNAKLEYEFLNNLKILQAAFQKFGIKKHLEIEKLSKCKYQDNLEMIQWMKRLFDCNGGAQSNYDPLIRRKGEGIDLSFANKVVQPKIFNPAPSASQTQQQPSKTKSIEREKEMVAVTNIKKPSQQAEKVVPSSKRRLSGGEDKQIPQNKLGDNSQEIQDKLQVVQVELLEKTNKLANIKQILLQMDQDDSSKVQQIASLLGMNSLIQASMMQQQQLQQQQQLFEQQQQQQLKQQKEAQLMEQVLKQEQIQAQMQQMTVQDQNQQVEQQQQGQQSELQAEEEEDEEDLL